MQRNGDIITLTNDNEIFVFGSNEVGAHGAGAAKFAYENYGAVFGQGFGLWGKSFAIPTKDHKLRTLELATIDIYVTIFLNEARNKYYLQFIVTPIGCGLAGYTYMDIAPMFRGAPTNVVLPDEFKDVMI